MNKIWVLLGILAASQATAQDFEAGRGGWQLERLSGDLVVLRTGITASPGGDRAHGQGLLILTCEPTTRRIRFQIGTVPRSPSIHASSDGRAMVRAWFEDGQRTSLPIYPTTYFFNDGSFEFRERAAFSDATMRGILSLLRKTPARLEILLFKGAETRAFRPARAMQFRLSGLNSDLAAVYGFEGLCFHTNP